MKISIVNISTVKRLLAMATMAVVTCYGWAEPLEKPNVTYEKRPSGRVYGSDGSVYDKLPTGKVYDAQGKAYGSRATPTGSASNLAKPLPRVNTSGGRSGNIRTGTPRR